MRTYTLMIATVIAALSTTSLPALAQTINGQVVKVDAAAGKLTIKHGPIKKFDMDDGMTMVWRAQDPADLEGIKPGDRIRFEPDRVNGQFTAKKIEKAK